MDKFYKGVGMHKKNGNRIFLKLTFALLFFLFTHLNVFAHPEISTLMYSELETGWIIKESEVSGSHSKNHQITYYLDEETFANETDNFGNGTLYLKDDFKNALTLWKTEIVELQFVEDTKANSIFKVYTENNIRNTAIASVQTFGEYEIVNEENNHLHYVSALIFLNSARMSMNDSENIPVIAHEIGHAIGLKDIYIRNDVLMYGYSPNFTKKPSSRDVKGARVILGLHDNSEHVFQKVSVSESEHKKVCTLCDGYLLEAHNWVDFGMNIGSMEHGKICSECNYINYSCASPITFGQWIVEGSKMVCKVRTNTCDNAHTTKDYDNTHLLKSNNNCEDCGYIGNNIWCAWVDHNWNYVQKDKISMEGRCYSLIQSCSKCKQNKVSFVVEHTFDDLCIDVGCENCDFIREVNHDLWQDYEKVSSFGICRYIKIIVKNVILTKLFRQTKHIVI